MHSHKKEYPETLALIKAGLSAEQIEIAPKKLSQYRFTPPENVHKILDIIVSGYRSRLKPHPTKKSHPFKAWFKQTLLEAQNHRCAYCGCALNVTHPASLDYATFEHVHARRAGGRHAFRNMVMACSFCNTLRDRMDMSANDFYYWVVDNRPKYERLLQDIARNRKCKDRGESYYNREGKFPMIPLYDYM